MTILIACNFSALHYPQPSQQFQDQSRAAAAGRMWDFIPQRQRGPTG
jgi:hypothetical protein